VVTASSEDSWRLLALKAGWDLGAVDQGRPVSDVGKYLNEFDAAVALLAIARGFPLVAIAWQEIFQDFLVPADVGYNGEFALALNHDRGNRQIEVGGSQSAQTMRSCRELWCPRNCNFQPAWDSPDRLRYCSSVRSTVANQRGHDRSSTSM